MSLARKDIDKKSGRETGPAFKKKYKKRLRELKKAIPEMLDGKYWVEMEEEGPITPKAMKRASSPALRSAIERALRFIQEPGTADVARSEKQPVPVPLEASEKPAGVFSDFDFINFSRQGLSYDDFEKIVEYSTLSINEWAEFIHLNKRTLQRYKASKKVFEQIYSERILEIARLLQHGHILFGGMTPFNQWLHSKNIALGKIAPVQLLDSTIGIRLLIDELTRIEHGVFA